MDSREYLLELVRQLDLAMEADIGAEHLRFVRALVAGGALMPSTERLERTLAAARAFLEAPSEESYGALQGAATDSYPFGPGDGCLAVPDLGVEGCRRGSGCVSGAGTLVCIAEQVGWDQCARAVRSALDDREET